MQRTLTALSSNIAGPSFFRNREVGDEMADANLQVRRHLFECRVTLLLCTSESARIGDAPVHGLGLAGELRADLAHPVAERDDPVEAGPGEVIQVLRCVGGDVDAAGGHDRNSLRVQRPWVTARAARSDGAA